MGVSSYDGDSTYIKGQISGPHLDAFGRQRVSSPYTLFDQAFPVTVSTLTMDSSTATGGTLTHSANLASAKLSTTTTSGSSVIFQSRRTFNYQPGKSFLILITGNIGAAKSNVRKRIGYFNANNGLFFEQTGSGISVVRRTFTSGAAVDNAVAQASWNLDKLDGTGASGHTLDFSLQQIFIIDFQWLGSGRIRFGFNIGGDTVYCHEIVNANVLSTPYMTSAILPVRVSLENTSTAASATDVYVTCMSIVSEGGYEPTSIVRYMSNGTTSKSVGGSGTLVPVLSIRKSSGYESIPVSFIQCGLFMNSVDDGEFVLIINGTLTGASWASDGGICDKDVTATAISGGTAVSGGYLRGAGGSPSTILADKVFQAEDLILGSSIAGVSDIMTIAVRNITSASTVFSFINYKEMI